MANMSYCRFRNTLADVEDCLQALRSDPSLNIEEAKAFAKMMERFEGLKLVQPYVTIRTYGDTSGDDE